LGAYGRIFISYRREDAAGDARGICDRLGRSFGAANVFMDVDRLLAGQRFDRQLDKALEQCDVLVAVIGSRWMELLSDYAQQDKRDYVRDEIAAALQRDIIVIPVMTGREANMPPLPLAQNLPENIRDLVMYQKHTIAHETFGRDAADLVASLRLVLRARRGPRPWRAIATMAVVALALIGAAVGYWMDIVPRSQPRVPQGDVAANSTTAAPMNSDAAAKKAEEARQQEAARKAEADAQLAADAARKRAVEDLAAKQAADAEAARKKAEADAKTADDAARKRAADDEAARKEAQAYAGSVTDCDRLAASPYDDDRPNGVAGILDVARIDFNAVAACDDAMRRSPETARFIYQAGRAAAGRKDNAYAAQLFRTAIAKGSVAALAELGRLYAKGTGVGQNYIIANSLYEKGAARGSSPAMTGLGELFENGQGVTQNYATARGFYEQAAALGNANAMYRLAVFYDYAHGVQRDAAEARKWYEKAAKQGHVPAMTDLGSFYAAGEGGPRDLTQARSWDEKAAALGDTTALANLRNLCWRGLGLGDSEARNCSEKAAALGSADAMLDLGLAYESGRGAAKDPDQARSWFQKAADAGNQAAKIKLKNPR
jgi:TPR repeat protein